MPSPKVVAIESGNLELRSFPVFYTFVGIKGKNWTVPVKLAQLEILVEANFSSMHDFRCVFLPLPYYSQPSLILISLAWSPVEHDEPLFPQFRALRTRRTGSNLWYDIDWIPS